MKKREERKGGEHRWWRARQRRGGRGWAKSIRVNESRWCGKAMPRGKREEKRSGERLRKRRGGQCRGWQERRWRARRGERHQRSGERYQRRRRTQREAMARGEGRR
eukprot:scaffold5104_cov28-Tisochrysis_lutea.AAC.1